MNLSAEFTYDDATMADIKLIIIYIKYFSFLNSD